MKLLSFFIFLFYSYSIFGQSTEPSLFSNDKLPNSWYDFNRISLQLQKEERSNGMSYLISGSLALAGGIIGTNITDDPLEKGIYAVFQTIGVASIGYGAYRWQVGDEERLLMETLRNSSELTDSQKYSILTQYSKQKKLREKKEKIIKSITHGLIAALNLYNASQQKQDGVKTTLNFIGVANLLACVSYSF